MRKTLCQANQKILRTHIFIGFFVLFGCRETQFNYSCGPGASTPTDLTITNNTRQEMKVALSVKEDELYEFKNLILSPDESSTLCIEYEGPITDGIYIDLENQTTIIKLRPQQMNEFTLKERSLK